MSSSKSNPARNAAKIAVAKAATLLTAARAAYDRAGALKLDANDENARIAARTAVTLDKFIAYRVALVAYNKATAVGK